MSDRRIDLFSVFETAVFVSHVLTVYAAFCRLSTSHMCSQFVEQIKLNLVAYFTV